MPDTPFPSMLLGANLDDETLFQPVQAIDQDGCTITRYAIAEKILTVFLNGREVVTVMTIGDHPEYLAVGFLLNQKMLEPEDCIESVLHDADNGTVMVTAKLAQTKEHDTAARQRIHTSGCAVGTLFGGVMESLEGVTVEAGATLTTSALKRLVRSIENIPSLHNKTGALHRCILCEGSDPVVYMEDVGRHNAIDKLAGYMRMNGLAATGKCIYTTGRLTSEVVIKTVVMGVPMLVSRSGYTALGIQLARQTGLTLIGRCRGRQFQILSGSERILFDNEGPLDEEEMDEKGMRKS